MTAIAVPPIASYRRIHKHVPLLHETCKQDTVMRDVKLPPRYTKGLPSSRKLCGVRWYVATDVSGPHAGPIFNILLDPRKWVRCCPKTSVTKYQPTPPNISYERRPQDTAFMTYSQLNWSTENVFFMKGPAAEATDAPQP